MNYPKAPIIEAVVQLVFSHAIEIKKIEAFGAKTTKSGWSLVDRNSFKLTLDATTTSTSAIGEKIGIELRNEYSNRIIILEAGSIILSNLAPYPGWNDFSEWIFADLAALRKLVGPLEVNRIGMRFINRLDVPYDESGLAYTEDFVSIHPQPFTFGGANFNNFYIGFTKQYENTDILYNLSCGTSESPVPAHVAVTLDIDAYIENFGAFNLDQVKSMLQELRVVKNKVFESAITDAARVLFGASR